MFDRPIAVQSYFAVDKSALRYKYILLGEPDYMFIKPFTTMHLPPPGEANAFPYGYIVPTYNEKNQKITRRITRNKFETVAQMLEIPGACSPPVRDGRTAHPPPSPPPHPRRRQRPRTAG